MFSVVFPGQGSQAIGMGKEFYQKYDLVKDYFKEADESLNFNLSDLILNVFKKWSYATLICPSSLIFLNRNPIRHPVKISIGE